MRNPNSQRQPHPLMIQFRELVKERGWTGEELRDLLNVGVLQHDPVCIASVYQWLSKTEPRGGRMLAIEDFIRTHRRKRKTKSSK